MGSEGEPRFSITKMIATYTAAGAVAMFLLDWCWQSEATPGQSGDFRQVIFATLLGTFLGFLSSIFIGVPEAVRNGDLELPDRRTPPDA